MSMKVYTRRQLMAKAPVPWKNQYLTFKAVGSGTFTLSQNAVSYSLDEGVTWNTLVAGTASPLVPAGKTIMWKGSLTPTSSAGIGTFSATNTFDIMGNPLSLIYNDNFKNVKSITGKEYAFYRLFNANAKLRYADNLYLTATYCVGHCYRQMFYNSTIISPPVIKAETFGTYSCNAMFQGCTHLTSAPELPAKNLSTYTYYSMFYGCTSLVSAPSILPATTLQSSCYQSMFNRCSKIKSAPLLPALTLVTGCYRYMFEQCSQLNYVKAMFTSTPGTSNNSTQNWLTNVASSGTFVKNSAATWNVRGASGIPNNWTIETADK